MSKAKRRVGLLGLQEIGQTITDKLLSEGTCRLVGYDEEESSQKTFTAKGGKIRSSSLEVAKESDFLVCSALDADQIRSTLIHGQNAAAKGLPIGAVILVCSGAALNYHETLRQQVDALGRQDIFILDCPTSFGTKREEGSLTIFASGPTEACERSNELLSEISNSVYHIRGDAGSASKVHLINLQLAAAHSAAAVEATALAKKAGLDMQEVYDIIVGPTAGDSWSFEDGVPRMIKRDWSPSYTVDNFVKDLDLVNSASRSLKFPLPISATVEQLYILASARGYGKDDGAGILRLFAPEEFEMAKTRTQIARDGFKVANGTPKSKPRIGFIGMGAMGYGMATSLVRASYLVTAFDVYLPSVDKFIMSGTNAKGVTTAAEATAGADLIVLMVQSAGQVDDVLFGTGRAIDSVPHGAIILLSTTVPPAYTQYLDARLKALRRGITLIDAPVSGGAARAATGDLTFICSGDEKAISKIYESLLAMAGTSSNVRYVSGGAGAASSVKMINQLLAGVHIAAAAEAMAFSHRLGLDMQVVFDVIKREKGWSWMFENRVPQILSSDWTPLSSLAIFVKDMEIVTGEARRLSSYAPISSAAYTLYLEGAAKGLTNEADIGVYRLWPLPARNSQNGD